MVISPRDIPGVGGGEKFDLTWHKLISYKVQEHKREININMATDYDTHTFPFPSDVLINMLRHGFVFVTNTDLLPCRDSFSCPDCSNVIFMRLIK